MIVIKYNKKTGEKDKVKYPAIWGDPVPNLDKDIVFYEIKELEKPSYDTNQFTIKEKYNLTEIEGDYLLICEVEYFLVEKPEAAIIQFLNNSVGRWIDGNGGRDGNGEYPLWEQNKHTGKAIRYMNVIMLGGTPTAEEKEYIDYITECADWAGECRTTRDAYEAEYKETGILPVISFNPKPMRDVFNELK